MIRRISPALLLALLFVAKLDYDPLAVGRSDDTYYLQIAQHVAEGDGLRTSVSLYEQGLRDLPAPATVQPLWPLVLGWSARVLGLERAATLLPEVLFFVDLLLLYALANRVGRDLGGEILVRLRGVAVLDLGTAAMALLGTQAVFFAYSSGPWTEAAAFALLLAALLALARAERGRAGAWCALAGALAGLAYLARSQLAGVAPALALAVWLVGLPARAALSVCAAALAVVAPWLAHLLAAVDPFAPRVLFDFSAHRETPGLLPFDGFQEAQGVGGLLADAARGLAQAFHPFAPESYLEAFGPIAWAVPVAACWAGAGALRGQLSGRPPLVPLAAVLAAAAALAPVHLLHGRYPYEWFFHWRHGLPLVLAVVPALGWLATRGPLARAAVVATLAVGLAFPRQSIADFSARGPSPAPSEAALAAWLDAQPRPPVLLSAHTRELAVWSRAVGHWTRCERPAEATRRQLALLPIDYVVVYPQERSCPFVSGLDAELEPVRSFGTGGPGIAVLRPRRTPAAER